MTNQVYYYHLWPHLDNLIWSQAVDETAIGEDAPIQEWLLGYVLTQNSVQFFQCGPAVTVLDKDKGDAISILTILLHRVFDGNDILKGTRQASVPPTDQTVGRMPVH